VGVRTVAASEGTTRGGITHCTVPMMTPITA
jgi:hypothetical protein